MFRCQWLWFSAACISGLVLAAEPVVLNAFTEEWPPYSFSDNGTVKGIATDLLKEIALEAGISVNIEVVPWKRAYETALHRPATLVFCTARSAEREQLFEWVGPIVPREIWLFGRPDSNNSLLRLDALSGVIGAVFGDATVTDLFAKGVKPEQIDYSKDMETVLRKFLYRRVNYFYDTEPSAVWRVKQQKLSLTELQKIIKISGGEGYYYAVNRKTSPDLVNKLRKALAKLKDRKRTEVIMQNYLSGWKSAQ
ncbi:substrate-binding periplasmic protein [Chitinimonas sp. PSY-7]|uniref:transporter substrate-binding domain-containing protein n=1 Tax=Chitinimonas sp. PSY-7 TaxID=3459088 RepID=UPI00403FFD40